eukprot:CAMPEP_0196810820 /NCGR_PEP_ID=MMETSP1362-20130617/14407_1 /TAXON_ID=163516 /ORGANISM="Leptocylindrus danicus, Strain CCMP1856" /LENGTH=305 /DNA_ID=CAMNT_0042185973 /DNA_START=37 /DNA_END=954 /DNA_ORIENTATION=-
MKCTPILSLLLFMPTYTFASCACETIDSWKNLKNIIQSSSTDALLRLCPFQIEKPNSESSIVIPNSMHIMCAKESRSDECIIQGTGNTESNTNHEAFKIPQNVHNVWFQGLYFQRIGKGVIKSEGLNLQITDSIFEKCQSPPKSRGAIVLIEVNSTATIIDTIFRHNQGSAVQSYGKLTVSHCSFTDNESTPIWISNDETENRGGGVGGAIMNGPGGYLKIYNSQFLRNMADKDGPAVWSYEDTAIDLGSNCGMKNHIVGNSPSNEEVILGVCDGIYYKEVSSGDSKGNLCASFGGECGSPFLDK